MADENKDIEQKIKLTYETNADEVSQQTNKLAEATENVATSNNNAAKSSKLNTEALKELAPNTTATISGFKGMTKAALAFIATPLGAILTVITLAVVALVSVFKTFVPLMDKVEQVVNGVSAAFNAVKNTILAVITGAKSLGDAFGGLAGETEIAYNETVKLTKAQQDLEDAMASQEVATARNRAVINRLNVELRNRTKTDEERLRIADEITKREKQDFDQRRKLVGEELRLARKAIAIKAQFSKQEEDLLKRTGDATKELAESRGGNYDEEYKRLNAARLKAIALEDEVTVNLEKTYSRRDKIEEDRQAKIDKTNAEAKARAEKAKAEREKQLQKEEEARKKEEQRKIDEFKAQQDLESQLKELDKKKFDDEQALKEERDAQDAERQIKHWEYLADKQKRIDEGVAEAKQVIQDKQFEVAQKGIALIAQLFGKNKALQKAALIADSAIGVAKTIISTRAANAAARLKYALLPGGAALAAAETTLNNVSAGIGIAANVAATSKALQSLGGGSANSSASNGGSEQRGSSATPQVSFQASSENQIATSVAGRINEQPPLKVYVTESDITQTQDKVKAQVSANTIG